MKFSITLVLILSMMSSISLAVTDAEIVGSVFTNKTFLSTMGDDSLKGIEIIKESEDVYQIVVNSKAPLSDGCSYFATITVGQERYAIDPLTTGVRTVLKVSKVKSNCGW